jgi:predicted RNase H-like HicB family nuclease
MAEDPREPELVVQLKVIIHPVPQNEGGGYWAEVPSLPGCATWGGSRAELEQNICEAIEGWLDAPVESDEPGEVIELAV